MSEQVTLEYHDVRSFAVIFRASQERGMAVS